MRTICKIQILMLYVITFAISCGFATKTASQGTEGGACYPNKTCNEGLVCSASLICVKPFTYDSVDDASAQDAEVVPADVSEFDTGSTDATDSTSVQDSSLNGPDGNGAQDAIVKTCVLAANPGSITFTNATSSKPEVQEFILSNAGDSTCKITNIAFKSPTSEFTPIDWPPVSEEDPVEIDPPYLGSAKGPVTLSVRYKPADETPDTNGVMITCNDPVNKILEIPLYSQFKPGKLEVTYADQVMGYLDFTLVLAGSCTKVVKLYNSGEGPLMVYRPEVKPDDDVVAKAYIAKVYKTGGSQVASCAPWECDIEKCEYNQAQVPISEKKSLDVVVTYAAPSGMGVNATLLIKYTTPYAGIVSIPMYGGSPKGVIEIAPKSNTISFNAKKGDPSKEKSVVIYNSGNGPLTVKNVTVEKDFLEEPDSYSLKTPWPGETTIDAWDLKIITVVLDTNNDDNEPNANMSITYVDPLSGADTEYPVVVHGSKKVGEIILPTANPGTTEDYAGAEAGSPVTLNGTKSSGGSGEIWTNGYVWFLSGKPKSSKVFVNEDAGQSKFEFTPDIEGAYEIRLIVFTKDAFFSDEGVVTINVSK